MLKAWCMKYGMSTTFILLSDKPDLITEKIDTLISTHDVVMTSGGAWTGDRDFVADALQALGWKKIFHSIRIGPGKPVGFGTLNNKPIFLLPGGPPSNLTAFLQIALPGILRLGGDRHPALPRVMVTLTETVDSRHINWTQFVYGRLKVKNTHIAFTPLRLTSRLKSIAGAQGVIAVPEGVKSLSTGDRVTAQVLD